jgi:hypothetical protein
MRIGIHTGLVVSRVTEGEGMFLVSGDTVNLAARLQEAAEPGAVLVSDATQRLVAHAFATEPLGPIHFKGKTEPVTVFHVKSAWSTIVRPRRVESPLIGRQAELRVLQERIAQLRAGRGGVVTICGEAGIGKSRLVAEVHRHLRELNTPAFPAVDNVPRWVEGRCVSSRIAPPYALWIDILRTVLDVPQDASVQETSSGVYAWLQEKACGRHEDLFPPLARLFGPAIELDGEPAAGDAEMQRRLLCEAVRTVLTCAASREPLIVACEDVHWADASSLELWAHLLPSTAEAPLLLLGIFRSEAGEVAQRLLNGGKPQFNAPHPLANVRDIRPDDAQML